MLVIEVAVFEIISHILFQNLEIDFEAMIESKKCGKRLNIIKNIARAKCGLCIYKLLQNDNECLTEFIMTMYAVVDIDSQLFIDRMANLIEIAETRKEGDYLNVCNICKKGYEVIDYVKKNPMGETMQFRITG